MEERDKAVLVRLTESEKRLLQQKAEACGIKTEPFIRKLINGDILKARPPEEYVGLVRAINAIGSNINQIAYIANVTKNISLQEIEDIKKMQNDIVRLMRALG